MTEQNEFKTRADGTIDYAHHTARGRELRSAAFWSLLGKFRRPQRVVRAAGTKRPAVPRTPAIARSQA